MLEKFVFKCRDMRSFIGDIFISISKIKLNDYFLEGTVLYDEDRRQGPHQVQ